MTLRQPTPWSYCRPAKIPRTFPKQPAFFSSRRLMGNVGMNSSRARVQGGLFGWVIFGGMLWWVGLVGSKDHGPISNEFDDGVSKIRYRQYKYISIKLNCQVPISKPWPRVRRGRRSAAGAEGKGRGLKPVSGGRSAVPFRTVRRSRTPDGR
jgi:hypothetical protein